MEIACSYRCFFLSSNRFFGTFVKVGDTFLFLDKKRKSLSLMVFRMFKDVDKGVEADPFTSGYGTPDLDP